MEYVKGRYLSDMTGGPFSLFAYVGSKFDNPKKQIMTIEEYKKKFLELFKQLEEEHGSIREVEIWKEEICPNLTRGDIKIVF